MNEEIEELAARAVADIDYHWGSAYVIWHSPDGFHALPKFGDDVAPLSAPTAPKLRVMIRADYEKRKAQ